jgi:hypothetical protein
VSKPYLRMKSNLTKYVQDGSTPYLTAMIAYGRIGSKVWRSVAGFDGTGNDVKKDEIGYLDYQVLQWHKAIPGSLAFLTLTPARKRNQVVVQRVAFVSLSTFARIKCEYSSTVPFCILRRALWRIGMCADRCGCSEGHHPGPDPSESDI